MSEPARSRRTGRLGVLERARLRLSARLGRLLHWEFWPSWAVYLPLVPWFIWWSLRYGGLRTCTLANPGIPLGGIVGESKWDILRLVPESAKVPTILIEPGAIDERVRTIQQGIEHGQWSWPIVLKPDLGERGSGVRLVKSIDQARRYLVLEPRRVLAQVFHPGPYEVGIFYTRMPGSGENSSGAGAIFSITDKQFARVIGDGRSRLRDLVWRHPRFRMQGAGHIGRLGSRADDVPGAGEVVALGMAGNHCRGTMFLDGAGLITPELSAAIDRMAREIKGFYFGRFDVRYRDPAALATGRLGLDGVCVLELNGLSSESTNIYDPSTSFWKGQRVLRAQWTRAFEIGASVRRQGLGRTSWGQVFGMVRWWMWEQSMDQLSSADLTKDTHRSARRGAPRIVRLGVRAAAWVMLLTLVGVGIVSCGGPSMQPNSAALAALERASVPVPGHNGRTLSYQRAGDPNAQRVIFIHGSPGDASAFADYLINPIPGTECVSVDRLGFGDSTTGVDAEGAKLNNVVTSYAEQAEAIKPLLVERNGRWPILVGHSLGGPIAAQLAAEAPDRVGGVLILAGSLNPEYETPKWYNNVLDWAVVRWITPTPIAHSNDEMMACRTETTKLADILKNVSCPVIVMHGEKDTLVPFGNAAYAKARLTGATSVEIVSFEKEGHFLPWRQEPKVRELVEKLRDAPAQR